MKAELAFLLDAEEAAVAVVTVTVQDRVGSGRREERHDGGIFDPPLTRTYEVADAHRLPEVFPVHRSGQEKRQEVEGRAVTAVLQDGLFCVRRRGHCHSFCR